MQSSAPDRPGDTLTTILCITLTYTPNDTFAAGSTNTTAGLHNLEQYQCTIIATLVSRLQNEQARTHQQRFPSVGLSQ